MAGFDLDKVDFDSLVPTDPMGADSTPLKSTMTEAVKINPESQVKLKKLSRDSGVPIEAVKTDPASVESSLNLGKINFDEMSKRNPNTAKYLTDYNNASIAHPDVDPLTRIEDIFSGVKEYGIDIAESFKRGGAMVESSEIGVSSMWSALGVGEPITDEQAERLKALELSMQAEDEYGFIAGIPVTAAEQLPILWEIMTAGAGYAAIGAAPGLAVSAIPGAAPAALPFAVAGAKLGGRLGVAKAAFDLEAGLAFNEFSVLTDEVGNTLDKKVAGYAAATVGAVNAGLESISIMALGRTVTPAVRAVVKSKVKRALLTETGREAMKRIALAYTAAVATESVTEGLQEFTNVLGAEFAKLADEGSFTEQNIGTALDNVLSSGERIVKAAKKGLQASILLSAPGTAVSVITENKRKKQLAENEQAQINDLNAAVTDPEFKLNKLDKESFREFMQGAAGEKDVFIDGAQVSLYLQSKTEEEIQADPALQLLQKNVKDSAATGGDMTVPVSDFATDVAGTEHYDALREHMKLSPETATPFRQEQEQTESENYIKTLIDEAQESASTYVESQDIFESVRDQLIDTGRVTPQQAGVMADIVPAWATVQAQSRGIPVSQVYQESGLHIKGPLTGEAARLAREDVFEQKEMLDKVTQDDIFNIGETERRIEDDIYIHDRLPQGARAASQGSTLESASTVARRSLRSVSETESAGFPVAAGIKGRKQEAGNIRKAETEFLKRWAEQENLIIPDFEQNLEAAIKENDGQQLGGRDNYVFLDETSNRWMKANRFTYAPTFADLFDSIALHNEQFPSSEYTFEGLAEVKGELLPIFSQANIVEDEGITDEQKLDMAVEYLESLGYTRTDPSQPVQTSEFTLGDVIVEDIHPGNVIINNGLAYIFDPIIRLNPETKSQRVIGREAGGERQDIGFEEDVDLEALGAVFEQRGIDTTGIAKLSVFEQAAYHGTPHKFDKFTLDHIGTGEGVQAYGWGLYFAENKNVAKFYKEQLTREAFTINGKPWQNKLRSKFAKENIEEITDALQLTIQTHEGDLTKIKSELFGNAAAFGGIWNEAYKIVRDAKSLEVDEGALLKVELAPKADEWLDWDKPLNEQSEKIQNIFEEKLDETFDPQSAEYEPDANGAGIYEWLVMTKGGQREASLFLKDIGIPGIKYFDQASRGKFVHKPISKEERTEITARLNQLQKVEIPKVTTAEEAKSLDAEQTRLQTKLAEADTELQTSNFVVFDEKLIQIQQFLQKPQNGGAKGYYDPANSLIRLTESSDLSTFLHEFAHFMYDMELKNPESQMTEKIHNWFKRNAEDVAKEANGYVGKEGALELEQVELTGDPDAPNYMRKYLEANNVEVNSDNTVTLYHVTTPAIAEKINKEGLFKGGTGPVGGMTGLDLKPAAFFGLSKEWVESTWGEGREATLEVKVPAEFLRHGAQNFKEFYFEGGLKKQADGTWKPEELRSTFVDRLAKIRYGTELAQADVPPVTPGDITAADVTTYLDAGTSGDTTKDSAIERAVHEQFARGFETYLMEGKAPSVELRNVFRAFARWLTQIYRAISGDLKVNLDQEMRDVFARMIATEEQIAAAEARAQFEPLFTDAAMAGMNEEEFRKHQEKQAKAKDKASETLRDKLIKQLTRQQEKQWKEEKSDIVDEEIERLKKEQVYVAKDTLLTGTFKLDRKTVKEIHGEERTDKLGRKTTRIPEALRNMTASGGEGVHPDEAAGFLGYNSGDELVQALINAPNIKVKAAENAEQIMLDRHGDIMNDGTIEKEADEAVQNEERGKLILDELKVLSKGTGRAVIERQMLKTMAEENIGKLSFRNIHPGKYRKAEIRAAQEAAAALATGNKDEAATAKARQALNFYLGKAATDAKNDTMKIVDRMARYKKKSVREAIMKAEGGYWEQLTKILTRFEFRKGATLGQVDRLNVNIAEWAKTRIEEDGDGLILTPEILDEGYVTHWKNVPYDVLQGVNDSVKNIEHVARYSNKITRLQEEMDFKKLVQKWTDSMNEKVKTRFKSQRTDVTEGKKWGRWAMAQMTKIPYMASWLDGQERAGISHEILVQPFTDAYNEELQLWNEVGSVVMDAIKGRSKEDIARHNQKIFIPEIKDADNDGNIYGHQVLATVLNAGNESSLKKLLLGEGWANPDIESEISIENPKLQAVLAHLTKSDMDLVQLVWDQMDVLYPRLAEVHRKTTGLTPPKIEATPVVLSFGTYKGGYYPVKYDPNRSIRAQVNEDRLNAETESMFGRVGIQASVNASSTNERTGYYAPVRLSLDIIPNHFQETIHYITHHDAVRETNKLIKNESVANTIKEKLGPEEYAQLRPWLNDIAKDGREAPLKMFWGSMLQRLRFGTTLGVMGFKASTGIIQILGLSNTIAEVGSGPVYQAVRSILGSTTTMQTAWDFAVDNSKVMSHRVNTMDREIKNAMQKLEGKRGIFAAVQETSMKHIALMQTYMVDLPSWHAAYIKGMKDWGDEKRSYAYADWVIENIQGSGVTKDMAQIMRNQSQESRMFTMFMTFFSSLWNQERDIVKGARAGTYSRTTVAAKLMFVFAIPVFLEMLMRGEFGDDDEEESNTQKYLTNLALYPVQSIPFVRDVASATLGEYGYNISPIAQMVEAGTKNIPELITRSFTDEEITKGQVKGATKFIGAVAGVPGVNQAWATGEHLYSVLTEGEELTLNQLLYGPRRR